jgi:aryl sulfotransferase
MTGPGDNGNKKQPEGILQEVRASAESIIAYLNNVGINDIAGDEALVLLALSLGASPDSLRAGVLRDLDITPAKASQIIDGLIGREYIEFCQGPGDGGEQRAALTSRGAAAFEALKTGVIVARWTDFSFRPGDIVVSTWPKSGTTWMQMICALLVFQTPELPAPLGELSPHLEWTRVPRDEMFAALAAQQHRRVIKTHLPLDAVPVVPTVTYVTVARHPLDAALSFYSLNQQGTKTGGKAHAPNAADRPPTPDQPMRGPTSPREDLVHWIHREPSSDSSNALAGMLQLLSAAWELREEPNMLLLHYEELSADLEGEMRRIAARLGIVVPAATWPHLVEAATFKQMQASPERYAPADLKEKEVAAFFNKGTSGQGRRLLTSEELARYHARAAQLAPADLLAWLHRQ